MVFVKNFLNLMSVYRDFLNFTVIILIIILLFKMQVKVPTSRARSIKIFFFSPHIFYVIITAIILQFCTFAFYIREFTMQREVKDRSIMKNVEGRNTRNIISAFCVNAR